MMLLQPPDRPGRLKEGLYPAFKFFYLNSCANSAVGSHNGSDVEVSTRHR